MCIRDSLRRNRVHATGDLVPAATARVRGEDPQVLEDRMWLLDTGCPSDLIQLNSLTGDQFEMREKAEHPIALETANDRVEADQCVPMQVDGIYENIEPLCLPATPSVLNVGKRCRVHGYGFYWDPFGESPSFVAPDGSVVPVETHEDVPYYRDICNKQIKAQFRGPHCGAAAHAFAAPAVDDDLEQGGGDALDPEVPVEEHSASPYEDAPADADEEESAPEGEGDALAPSAGKPAEGEPGALAPSRPTLEQARSPEHLYDHRVYNPYCKHCVRGKAQRRAHKKGKLVIGPAPVRFGDQVTGDSLIDRTVIGEGDEYFPNSTNAFVMYDRATQWIECHPKATLSYEDTLQAMRNFQGTYGRKVRRFYADNFASIAKAAKTMHWTAPTSTPGVPQTNGLAERKIRQVRP